MPLPRAGSTNADPAARPTTVRNVATMVLVSTLCLAGTAALWLWPLGTLQAGNLELDPVRAMAVLASAVCVAFIVMTADEVRAYVKLGRGERAREADAR